MRKGDRARSEPREAPTSGALGTPYHGEHARSDRISLPVVREGEPSAPPEPGSLLSRGNAKLGRDIRAFNLPARHTCPGRSSLCAGACYATAGHFHRGSVRSALWRHHRATLGPDFVARVLSELLAYQVRVVRIHGSGDFYSARYVRLWQRIAVRAPRTVFVAYTRSWRDRAILPALLRFACLPN